jgi:hypothetical protein
MLAVRLVVGVGVWFVLLCLGVTLWDDFVEATGETVSECDRGKCGALGEFTHDHPLILLLLFLAGTAIPALAIGWLLGRLFRSSNAPPDRDAVGSIQRS